ncbi:MAG: hypothetical protein AAB432_00760 [Patescibacteria group bacterium]
MALEDLEKKLYQKRFKGDSSGEFQKKSRFVSSQNSSTNEETKHLINENWSEENSEEPLKNTKNSFFSALPKSALFFGAALAVIIIVVFAIFLLNLGRSAKGANLEVVAPNEISRGVPFDLTLQVTNQSDILFNQASFTLNLPIGLVYLGGGLNSNQSMLVNEDVGDVGSGSFAKKTFKFLPTGEVNSLQKINITFSYGAGGRSRFETSQTKEILIKSPGVSVEIVKPDHVVQGSAFTLEVRYKNISNFDFPNVSLVLNYPTTFKFISASLAPDSLNNVWRLGELNAGSSGDLEIKGLVTGITDQQFAIPVTVSAGFLGRDYPIFEQAVSVDLAPSPVTLAIAVNHQTDYIARIGDQLTYTINYQNNSGIALADTVLNVSLAGELFDFGTMKTDGALNSITNTVSWNAANLPNFKLLDAGASGEVKINVGLKKDFPIKHLNDKNFYLKVNATLTSPSVPYYLAASETSVVAASDIKVSGFATVSAQAFYRDALSGFVNNGVLPPKVNQPTDYTIHWLIKNFSTDIKNIEIHASLAGGVAWTGLVKSNIDTVPLYNDRTQEIVWTIDRIPATKGVLSNPVEAIFQVRATPNVTEVGRYKNILSDTILKAVDDFTGLELNASDITITTALPDDRTVGQDAGRVIP